MYTEPPQVSRDRRPSRVTIGDAKTQIVDAAFADLETTALRSESPAGPITAGTTLPSWHSLTRQLSAQLRLLDDQRQRLAKLLRDLQSSPPD